MKQFSVFSDPNRSRENPAVKELSDPGSNSSFERFSNRLISVG
ncbi:hypothetical protein [uncultured Sunxiuqinia sp.]|nr:hypothetical protein [uncultured Sunxiuqinia sp.]